MYTKVAASVLASALLAQGATIGHSHLHKKAPAARSVSTLSDVVSSAKIVDGVNHLASEPCDTWDVAIGQDDSVPYQIKFINAADEDLILLYWSASSGNYASDLYAKQTVNNPSLKPAINTKIAANDSVILSVNPAFYGGSVSAGFAPFYSSSCLASPGGQVNDTLGELTFQSDNMFSTIDVSQLSNMNGSNMTIDVYDTQESSSESPLCTANLEQCNYICAPGTVEGHCENATANNCAGLEHGSAYGCMGMTNNRGYIEVTFSGFPAGSSA